METGLDKKLFDAIGRTLTTIPEGLQVHKTLNRVLDAKRQMFATGENFDWATGEALAFGSLLSEGYGVRLSGQDRGAVPSRSVTRSGSTRPTSISMCR
ncbi:hypothetical protein GCM10020258_08120 [Sphingomonas yabuuchiae]